MSWPARIPTTLTPSKRRVAIAALLGAAACNGDGLGASPPMADLTALVDMAGLAFSEPDLEFDLAPPPPADPCGDSTDDLACRDGLQGPPNQQFPLQSDGNKNPLENDHGVSRDADGFLVLHGSVSGTYSLIVKGCIGDQGYPIDTEWWQMEWEADVPPNTSLIVHAKSGNAASLDDPSWMTNSFTPDASVAPVNLRQTLTPNINAGWMGQNVYDPYLYIEFRFSSRSPKATPKLKSFDAGFKCEVI